MAQDKTAWRDILIKELRGKPTESVLYEIEPGIVLDPIYMPDELVEYPPISWGPFDAKTEILEKDPLLATIGNHSVIDLNKKVKTNEIVLALHRTIQLWKEESITSWDELSYVFIPSNKFLCDISCVRAFKLTLYALANEINKPLQSFPQILASVYPTFFENELETIIERTIKSLALSLSGVDGIFISEDFTTAFDIDQSVKSRIILNIQRILNKESEINKIEDIGNGAWWIEMATQRLFEMAWSKFQKGGES